MGEKYPAEWPTSLIVRSLGTLDDLGIRREVEESLQNKKEDDDAKALNPAHLYYKGNSEKRLENKTSRG